MARCCVISTVFLDVTPCSLVDRFQRDQHVPEWLSETFIDIYQTTRRQISGNVDYNIYSRVNLKSHRLGADEKGAASTNYRGPGPDCVAYVYVLLGSILCNYAVICRVDGICSQRSS